MRLRRHLFVFAKAPALGRVKSRLARDVGQVAALAFYRQALGALLARLARDRRWRSLLAVTPDRAAGAPGAFRGVRAARGIRRVAQGPGGLGQRMARALREAPPGPAVIIGSDIPDITAARVAAAFRALGSVDVVLGPAPDGGYWLVGMRRGPKLPDLFRAVRWSSATTLADTLANLPRTHGRGVRLIETLDDIDDGAALRRWRGRNAWRAAEPNNIPVKFTDN